MPKSRIALVSVSSTYGYIIGDALLVEVGAALAQRTASGEFVARLPGDNFVLFLPGVRRADVARARIEVFAEAFEHGFSTGDREGKEFISLSATIGVDVGVKGKTTIDALLTHAQTAAFAARRTGRGKTAFYSPDMASEEVVREGRLRDIAHALEHEQFELYYQPHVDLKTGRITGAEALIRWSHPERGIIEPESFIAFAEEHGAIRPISRWVMRTALAAADRLRALDPGFRLYFNLAADDMSDMSLLTAFRQAAAKGARLENIGAA
jgi:diguanylate cyclase (GGDEF)-like protein